MGTLHRAQLLLEAEQHQALMEIAEREGRSISDLVREIVRHHLDERSREAQILKALQAIDQMTQVRARLRERYGTYQGDPQDEVRGEWENDIERIWREA